MGLAAHDVPFAMRLRFWATKGIGAPGKSLKFEVAGHEVKLSASEDRDLELSGWYFLEASGFTTAQEAQNFGHRLALRLQIASVREGFGVDTGHDNPGLQFSNEIKALSAKKGAILRDNVHGVDVFPDLPGTGWLKFKATGRVAARADRMIADVQRLTDSDQIPQPLLDALRIWNEAYISGEPASKAALAIAAVEMLAQKEEWSAEQRQVVEKLRSAVDNECNLAEGERDELKAAIQRIYKIGVIEGVRRILRSLGQDALIKSWVELYKGRSRLLHGLAYVDRPTQVALVQPALAISGRIILLSLSQYVPGAADDLDRILPMPA